LLAVAVVITTMTKTLPGLARLLAPLVLKTVDVSAKPADGKKKTWFKNDNVGSKEIVTALYAWHCGASPAMLIFSVTCAIPPLIGHCIQG
jgi:hypothetical protein